MLLSVTQAGDSFHYHLSFLSCVSVNSATQTGVYTICLTLDFFPSNPFQAIFSPKL